MITTVRNPFLDDLTESTKVSMTSSLCSGLVDAAPSNNNSAKIHHSVSVNSAATKCTVCTTKPSNWEAQIRRAAGGKDTLHLQNLITTFGLTATDLDAMAHSDDGKSALHMAAWKGSLSNIEYLIQWGCHVNNIARGKYTYGKTPIFFAMTQCRDDAVVLLLQHGALVRIVNNKGQSVLSLASSHVSEETIQRIKQAEVEQERHEWINYRETHSDGAVYGDLDPRFYKDCDYPREVSGSWIKTDLAINPTTRLSRRGAFARRNSALVYQEKIRLQEKKLEKRRKRISSECHHIAATQKITHEQEESWQRLIRLTMGGEIEIASLAELLLFLVRSYLIERRAWIPEVATRLSSLAIPTEVLGSALYHLERAMDQTGCTPREWMLLQKVVQTNNNHPRAKQPTAEPKHGASFKSALTEVKCDSTTAVWYIGSFHNLPNQSRQGVWDEACRSVQGLSSNVLQNPEKSAHHLSLPCPPIWVDTVDQLQLLHERLAELDGKSSACIAFDTEWSHSPDDDTQTQVSTLQLAIHDPSHNGRIPTWIVDLQTPALRKRTVAFVQWLLHKSATPLLGFAVGRDLRKLEEYISQAENGSLYQRVGKVVLDLQLLCATTMLATTCQPGLQACCRHFVSSTYFLGKQEQRSDWARRPLTPSQMEYAGLDAAVLLVLLAQVSGYSQYE